MFGGGDMMGMLAMSTPPYVSENFIADEAEGITEALPVPIQNASQELIARRVLSHSQNR